MKIRLAVALLGLATSLTVPTLAQQKETADQEIRQVADSLARKLDEAWNNNDAAAAAALRKSRRTPNSWKNCVFRPICYRTWAGWLTQNCTRVRWVFTYSIAKSSLTPWTIVTTTSASTSSRPR